MSVTIFLHVLELSLVFVSYRLVGTVSVELVQHGCSHRLICLRTFLGLLSDLSVQSV